MESYDNLRRSMIMLIENRDAIPGDVMQLVIKIFDKAEEMYKELGCHNSAIETYMQGNLSNLIAMLQGRIGSKIKEGQYYQVETILSEVQRNLEETLDDEEQKRRDNKVQYSIEGNSEGANNNIITARIAGEIEDALKDVQSRQNQLLSVRGYNDAQIEDINYEMTTFIRQLIEREEENILIALQSDDAELKKQLLTRYETYICERNESNKPKETTFRESLDAGISLEEQRNNALKFQEETIDRNANDKRMEGPSLADLFK